MEGEVTNTIVVSSLIKSTDLSHAGASAVIHGTISDLVSSPLPLSLHFLSTRPPPCLLRAVWPVSDRRAQPEEGPPSS